MSVWVSKQLCPCEPIECSNFKKILRCQTKLWAHRKKVHTSAACSIGGAIVKTIGMYMDEKHTQNSKKKYYIAQIVEKEGTNRHTTNRRILQHVEWIDLGLNTVKTNWSDYLNLQLYFTNSTSFSNPNFWI